MVLALTIFSPTHLRLKRCGGGGTASELITQARAGLCQIATGSYVGTGKSGQNDPTVINCGFKPKMMLFWRADQKTSRYSMLNSPEVFGVSAAMWVESVTSAVYNGVTTIYFEQTETGLSLYAPDPQHVTYSGEYQNNAYNRVYYYLAIG